MRQCGKNTKHIVAFPLQAWLCQHTTVLYYVYIVSLILLVSHQCLGIANNLLRQIFQLKFTLYISSVLVC